VQENGSLTLLGDLYGHDGLEGFEGAIGAEPCAVALGDAVKVVVYKPERTYIIEHAISAKPAKPTKRR